MQSNGKSGLIKGLYVYRRVQVSHGLGVVSRAEFAAFEIALNKRRAYLTMLSDTLVDDDIENYIRNGALAMAAKKIRAKIPGESIKTCHEVAKWWRINNAQEEQ